MAINHPYVRKPSTLRTTIQEDIVLNGDDYSSTTVKNFPAIYEIHRRVVTCPSGGATILMSFHTSGPYGVSLGMDTEDTKYIRITNLDDTNPVELAFIDSADCYTIRVSAGENYILGSPSEIQSLMTDEDISITTLVATGTMRDLVHIKANPGGNAVDLELFIASEKVTPVDV